LGVLPLVGVNLKIAHAVEPGKPSKTSIMAAARRAVASHDYDPTVRNPDWLAEHFLGPVERSTIPDYDWVRALDMDYREAEKLPGSDATGGNLIRTRFGDERLEKALLRGTKQVVILGAGFDSRAYRMKELLKGVKVFEVDDGPPQEYKRSG